MPIAISSRINPMDHISDLDLELKSNNPSSSLSEEFSNQDEVGWYPRSKISGAKYLGYLYNVYQHTVAVT